MKTQFTFKILIWFAFMPVVLAACKDEQVLPDPVPGEIVTTTGISENELATYAGDIGMVLEARSLVNKGYKPAKAKLTVNATSGDYSQSVELDEYSFMGQIKLAVEDLSEEAQNELTDGVEVVAELLDASGSSLVKETFSKVSFKSNPETVSVQGSSLEDLNTEVHLKANTPYYVQVVVDGAPTVGAMKLNPLPSALSHITGTSIVSFTGDEDALLFSFEAFPGETNTYAIRHIASGDYLRIHRNYIGNPTGEFLNIVVHHAIVADLPWSFPQDFAGKPDAKFVIEKESDGVYHIQGMSGERIKVAAGVGYTINHPEAEDISFRFVPMNIDWEIESIASHYLEPILPPAKNGFGFNNTLINCGNGVLEQTVGVEISETINNITGWQESISIMSSHTASVSLTLGLEVSGSFFGNGATYSAEATAGYEYTTESTTENTKWIERESETTETYFSERVVTVPPKNASLVYDAFQSYDDIKVNFVQRLRVRAMEHDTNEPLSGEEISSQFHFNGFNGVITEIGSDFIEVTLRGVTELDKIIKTKSEVRDADPMCN